MAELAGRSVLVDCDVDAANLHLLVNHMVLERHEFSSSRQASIDDQRCTRCGLCEAACRFNAIVGTPDRRSEWGTSYSVRPFACEGCGLCYRTCPEQAIDFKDVVSGDWYLSESDYGPFLHARLGIAESNSGRLVSLLRKQARDIAVATDTDLIIADGPPGIGCPVAASLTDASYLLVVTEPTVSGLHDMTRLVELARHFSLPTGICINKHDLNDSQTSRISEYAGREGLTVHSLIPFDRGFTEAQATGRPYLGLDSSVTHAAIEKLWAGVWQDMTKLNGGRRSKFAV
jgi:MinD superfamily P-loop ATPase